MSRIYAYVDETGDRGSGASASPIFGMAAVIVDESDAVRLREAVETLRADFTVPSDRVMSWKQDAKTHDRRKRAVEVLRVVPGLQICYVYVKKSQLQPGTYGENHIRFYNYVAYKAYKSIVWAGRGMGAEEIHIRFGHVRHHDHRATRQYIEWMAQREGNVPNRLVGSMRWVSADSYAESQAADLFGGFLRAATWPSGPFHYVEPSYLLEIWSRLRNSGACAIPQGIMSMPTYEVLTAEKWFPCGHCTK